MGEHEDKVEDLNYAAHCEQMAATANETDKELWLKMASAWRRERLTPLENDGSEPPASRVDP